MGRGRDAGPGNRQDVCRRELFKNNENLMTEGGRCRSREKEFEGILCLLYSFTQRWSCGRSWHLEVREDSIDACKYAIFVLPFLTYFTLYHI